MKRCLSYTGRCWEVPCTWDVLRATGTSQEQHKNHTQASAVQISSAHSSGHLRCIIHDIRSFGGYEGTLLWDHKHHPSAPTPSQGTHHSQTARALVSHPVPNHTRTHISLHMWDHHQPREKAGMWGEEYPARGHRQSPTKGRPSCKLPQTILMPFPAC